MGSQVGAYSRAGSMPGSWGRLPFELALKEEAEAAIGITSLCSCFPSLGPSHLPPSTSVPSTATVATMAFCGNASSTGRTYWLLKLGA